MTTSANCAPPALITEELMRHQAQSRRRHPNSARRRGASSIASNCSRRSKPRWRSFRTRSRGPTAVR